MEGGFLSAAIPAPPWNCSTGSAILRLDMKLTTLYLIRHAQSAASLEIEEAKWPLSDVGGQQAAALTDLLDPLGIGQVYSSPYLRARDTVRPFAAKNGLDVILVDDLAERGLTRDALGRFGEVWRVSWDDLEYAPANCESSREAQERFTSAVRRIVQETTSTTIAICSHGHVIALFLRQFDEPFGREQAEALRNPDVLRLHTTGNGWLLDREFKLPGLDNVAGRFRD